MKKKVTVKFFNFQSFNLSPRQYPLATISTLLRKISASKECVEKAILYSLEMLNTTFTTKLCRLFGLKTRPSIFKKFASMLNPIGEIRTIPVYIESESMVSNYNCYNCITV